MFVTFKKNQIIKSSSSNNIINYLNIYMKLMTKNTPKYQRDFKWNSN